MLKRYTYTAIILIITTVVHSQVKEFRTMSFNQLQDSMSIRPKPILIKITTDWCAICKIQDQQLLKDTELLKTIFDKYYFIELNAETKETIIFNNVNYKYISNGMSNGINELAFKLGNKQAQLSYPTWVILDQNYQILFKYTGLIKNDVLKKL